MKNTKVSSRRHFLKAMGIGAVSFTLSKSPLFAYESGMGGEKRPNILFCIADDWGPDQAGILGNPVIKTPNFDSIAKKGVLFTNAFVTTPSCTASRAAILTGQMPHRLGPAINLSSRWEKIPPLFTDLLSDNGYYVGYMRKGWGPGEHPNRKLNPAGKKFDNFERFLQEKPENMPFFFWFGSYDPHRGYNRKLTEKMNIDKSKIPVPPYLPDKLVVREDLADYYAEVQRFDVEVGQLLNILLEKGLADNTMVVMTGDHGLPFPRAKCHLYDAGTKVPLAIRWGTRIKPGRRVKDLISFTDFAPTFLDIAGIKIPSQMTGKSFLDILMSEKSGQIDLTRDKVFTERERHTWCHPEGKSFPVRALRTKEFLYIYNFRPNLYPAGHPYLRRESKTPKGHVDCDEGPTKYYIIDNKNEQEITRFYKLAFDKRPQEELYELEKDPYQMKNLAEDEKYLNILKKMRDKLKRWMEMTKDPRAEGETDIWDSKCVHLQPYADVKMPGYTEE